MAAAYNPDFIKERVKFLTELLKLVAGLLILDISGTLALIVKKSDQASEAHEWFFILLGMLISVILGITVKAIYSRIDNYINLLNR